MPNPWIITARPKTLPVAASSIITGSALAFWQDAFEPTIALLCLVTTLLLQILSNFANDYGDHQKGSDTAERIGPVRSIQTGSIDSHALRRALMVVIALCVISGSTLLLVAVQSMVDLLIFLTLGLCAIIAAIAYTMGARPYGYRGLGDVSVLIFFGILGVGGSFYLQTHIITPLIFLPAIATGLLAAAVLNINNLRDIEQDYQAGKLTLAVKLGAHNARHYHALLLILSLCLDATFVLITDGSLWRWLFMLSILLLYCHLRAVYHCQSPLELRPLLAQMAILTLIFNGLFSLGLILDKIFG
ncbi:1,4-dihydroxy-2-naphthoate polyprenyltransferase [Moraxella sp. FZFQ2102]|uniref:1,4-dihydroxy-2-naphthoate polyprenyltransferase n=1 Tax=Moraxella sp. FZFQ2102 TaxID=2953752 RepID=UPI00209C1996|nr:1,4-dihydroxy-2-naphthoate polyprenyltransferase [Moraxella sp. FZFQ2102]USZ14449.1 1,4-dihydroxy-2-naphthoate polyprenyltransferase [Moraxella sp. FZFQ2102]